MRPYLLAASLAFLPLTSLAAQTPTEVVESFIQAYNKHDVELMVQHTSESVRWMHISGTKVEVETSDRTEFGAAMTDYFETLKDARATILKIIDSGNYVSTVERVTWDNDGEQLSQCSIGTFRVKGGKLAEFWYFPAHACDEPSSPEMPDKSDSTDIEPVSGALQEKQE
ncbi:nuclear transport factor 2 family protein [uncultured Shewanella sp.]|uniref:nuclear transport factor 2 family protein n=1 Tax=Shewanella atlantica TaxID=271099 RepID=UPI0026112CF2|nr:nuclear transport factor 2 family protein [uncultured Shewanella sp.]